MDLCVRIQHPAQSAHSLRTKMDAWQRSERAPKPPVLLSSRCFSLALSLESRSIAIAL